MISLIVIMHLVPGSWVASHDPAFARAMGRDYGWLAIFFGSLMITIAAFVIIGLRSKPSSKVAGH